MQPNKEEYYSLSDITGYIRHFFSYIRKKSWLLLLAVLIGAGVGTVYYYMQKPKYVADCTFILEEKQSGMGGLSGLASQFGFDIGSMIGGGSIFAGDNILEILKSRHIIQNVLLSKIDSGDSKSNKKLVDLFVEISGWKDKWENNERLKGINFENIVTPLQSLTLQQDSVLYLTYQELLKKHLFIERVTKKGSIVKVTVVSKDEIFSKLVSERIVNSAKEMYVHFKTNNASINVQRLERKADSLLRLLNNKSYQAASSIVIDANPALKSAIVPAEVNNRDKAVLQALYGEVVKNLEISRIALMQQTPIIQVLDYPTYPLENKKMKFLLSLAICSALLVFLTGIYLSVRYFFVKSL